MQHTQINVSTEFLPTESAKIKLYEDITIFDFWIFIDFFGNLQLRYLKSNIKLRFCPLVSWLVNLFSY